MTIKGKLDELITSHSRLTSGEVAILINMARAEFLLINEFEEDRLLDAIYAWYMKFFGDVGT